MQSILIVYQNEKFKEGEISKIKKYLHPSQINIIHINPETSIGIDNIRLLKKSMVEKPYGGGNRIVVIDSIEKATPEASNSLLKILEEPPESNTLVLTTPNRNRILATIVSRCKVITENINTHDLNPKSKKSAETFLKGILKGTVGDRLQIWPNYVKSKDDAPKFLDILLVYLENSLRDPEFFLSKKGTAQTIEKISRAKKYLERNVNYKATLDILFMGFPAT